MLYAQEAIPAQQYQETTVNSRLMRDPWGSVTKSNGRYIVNY